MRSISLTLLFICVTTLGTAQSKVVRTLFLGNSYTYVNDLPKMIADMALTTGDTFIHQRNTPGGYTLQGHASNASSQNMIAAGNWDYVVLQEQSQRPSFNIGQVQSDVFPYVRTLDSLIQLQDSCTETVFYMTWGRKNGDALNCPFFPPLCTYQGMDSLLNLRYRMMADSNDAILSPVGAVWNYIRTNHPGIELYQADESHPAVAGTYAAACSFYSVLFRKDPTTVTFNSSLDTNMARLIRQAAKTVVYDSLAKWHVGEYDAKADFQYAKNGNCTITFTNLSQQADSIRWDFGDGTTSNAVSPTHTYTQSGWYIVTLVAGRCGQFDTATASFDPCTSDLIDFGQSPANWKLYPNPANQFLNVSTSINGELDYEVASIDGKVLIKGHLDSAEESIDISELPEGSYLLGLKQQGQPLGYRSFVRSMP